MRANQLLASARYVPLLLAVLFTFIPLAVVLIASLKTEREFATSGPFALPGNWLNLANYVTAFTQGGMVLGFVNTVIIMSVSLVGTILLGTMAAYAIDRFEFRGRKLVLGLFLVATLIPAVTTQVATFQIINGLGLFNTRGSAILLFMGTDIVSIYIFIQYMSTISKSLDEAAMLDGANRWTIYWRIILPLLRPAIATAVIIKGIAMYNEFYIPFLYMPDSDLVTMSTSLFAFKGPFGAQWEVISAGTILVIVPTLVIFLVLQKQIYRGMTAGATK